MEDLVSPAYNTQTLVQVHSTQVGPSWMDTVVAFLTDRALLEDGAEADKIRRKTPRFWLSKDRKLYKRSYLGSYLLCVHLEAVEILLKELHEGICGSHTKSRSFAHRALT